MCSKRGQQDLVSPHLFSHVAPNSKNVQGATDRMNYWYKNMLLWKGEVCLKIDVSKVAVIFKALTYMLTKTSGLFHLVV